MHFVETNFSENQEMWIQRLSETSNALWKRDMMSSSEWERDSAKNWKRHAEKYAWSEIIGHEVGKRSIADVGPEWNDGSAGNN